MKLSQSEAKRITRQPLQSSSGCGVRARVCRLDILATLIDAYESEHHPIDPPDPSRRSNSGWSNKA